MDSAGSKIRSFGGRALSIGKTVGKGLAIAGAAAGVALVAVGKNALEAAAEAEQVAAQTAAVIKSTGGAAAISAEQVGKQAERLMALSGVSDEVIASGENLLLTFTNISNEVDGKFTGTFDRATQTMLDMSVALGQDTKSSAIQLGKALNDPIKGITALTRVGVSFTEQQKKQIEQMVKAGDVAGAQALILDELQREFGGSAEAAGKTFAGQMNILRETVGNAMEEVGADLMSVASDALPQLMDTFTKLVRDVGPVLGQFFGTLASTVGNILPMLAPILTELGKAIGQVLDALGPALGQALEALAPVIGELATAFADILVALVPLIPPLAELIASLAPLIKLVARAAAGLVKLLVPALNFVIKVVTKVIAAVVGFVTKWGVAWETIKGVATAIGGWVDRFILSPFQEVIGWLVDKTRFLRDVFGTVWRGIKAVLGPIIETIIGWIQDLIGWIQKAVDWLKELGRGVGQALAEQVDLGRLGEELGLEPSPRPRLAPAGWSTGAVPLTITVDRRRFGRDLHAEYLTRGW